MPINNQKYGKCTTRSRILFYLLIYACIFNMSCAWVKGHKNEHNANIVWDIIAKAKKYHPANGYVPDELTAIHIAVAVWTPIYGANKIKSQKPYHATLHDNIWLVEGTLHQPFFGLLPIRRGGTAVALISREDGKILNVIHTK